MTEAAGGGRAEIEGRLIQRSVEDDAFRRRLLEDTRAAMEEELGTRLPEGVEVRAVEEMADTIYLVLPNASAAGETAELSDQELEAVAGGYVNPQDSTSDEACGF
jgi:Nitrile hydratase, alpha chain